MLCCTAAGLFLIAAVAVRAAGGKGVLPHRICRAAGLAHRIIQVAQGGREVIQAKLLHQRTDAALGEATLTAAAVGVFVKLHVPREGVPGCRLLHRGDVLFREFGLPALSAKPAHRLCHHGLGVVLRQRLQRRAIRHGQDERTEQGAVDGVHLKPVGLLKFRQLYNGLAVFRLGLLCDGCRTHGVLAKHRRQLATKGFGK